MRYEQIKNIIFDLGDVIFNIDYDRTLQAFECLGVPNIENLFTAVSQSAFFDKYERRQLSTAHFRNELRALMMHEVSDDEIDDAWNAMLLDIPEERIGTLQKVRTNYRIFLLSNTNDLHLEAVQKIMGSEKYNAFLHLFENVYFSNKLGMRKPERGIFNYVLNENGLKTQQTVFIDDLIQHIEGAQKVGLTTIHLTSPTTLVDLFDENGLFG